MLDARPTGKPDATKLLRGLEDALTGHRVGGRRADRRADGGEALLGRRSEHPPLRLHRGRRAEGVAQAMTDLWPAALLSALMLTKLLLPLFL